MKKEWLYVVRQNNYWGAGKDLPEALNNFKKASGKAATNTADVSGFKGTPEDLERIEIDDVDGTIRYPRTVSKVK